MEPQSVQSVSRALRIVRFVAGSGQAGRRLSQVALGVGLHKASASRLLQALEQEGVVRRCADRRFRLCETFRREIGAPASTEHLRQVAASGLARIAATLGDATFLSVRSGHDALCVDRQLGDFPIQALSLHVGARRPLGVGAGSLALLAWLSEEERADIAAQQDRLAGFPHISERIIADAGEAARENGFTELRDVVVPGMTGLGVPVRNAKGVVVAALSAATTNERLSGARRGEAVALLTEVRDVIERSIDS